MGAAGAGGPAELASRKRDQVGRRQPRKIRRPGAAGIGGKSDREKLFEDFERLFNNISLFFFVLLCI